MYLTEFFKQPIVESTNKSVVAQFLPFVKQELKLDSLPKIKIVDVVPGADGTTFGRYAPEDNTVYVVFNNRHPKDALRTLAHELVHYKQDCENRITDTSGETGSTEENEANARAGIIMRNYNQANPEVAEATPVTPVTPVRQDPTRTQYPVPRKDDPAGQSFKDVLQQVKETFESDQEKARWCLDRAAQQLGYPNFASVRPGDLNNVRQRAALMWDLQSKPDHKKQF